jgi:hypothetical protein
VYTDENVSMIVTITPISSLGHNQPFILDASMRSLIHFKTEDSSQPTARAPKLIGRGNEPSEMRL